MEIVKDVHIPFAAPNKEEVERIIFDFKQAERTIYNFKQQVKKKMASCYEHGLSVFEDEQKFKNWLETPNSALNNQIPSSLLNTQKGIEQIDNILGRIEHGIFS